MVEQQSPSGLGAKKWLPGPMQMPSRISKYGPDLISTPKLATVASYCAQMCLKLIIIIMAVQQPKLTLASHQTPPSSPFIGQIHPLAARPPLPLAQWFRPETSMSANLSSGPPIAAPVAPAEAGKQIVFVATEEPTFLATFASATTAAADQTELGYEADNATLDGKRLAALRVLGMLYNVGIEGRRRRHRAADLQQEKQAQPLEATSKSLPAWQPESLLMGEEEAAAAAAATTVVTVVASSPSSNFGDASEAMEASVAAEDEDVVISSSEILTDNRQMAKLQPLNQKPQSSSSSHRGKHNTKQEHNHHQLEKLPEIGGPAKNCSGGQEISASADEVIASSDGGPDGKTSSTTFGIWLGSNANSAPSDDADLRHHLNSRLLLQILVVGLFGLVSLSLMVVYTIKFCVCRRRKRRLILLRRNLVADSEALACAVQQPQGNHALISPAQCTCPAAGPLAAPQPPARLESLFRPFQTGAGLWTIGGANCSPMANDDSNQLLTPSSLYQQLALAERLQARQHQHQMMMMAGGPIASGGVGPFCLGCHDTDPAHQNHGIQLQQQQQQQQQPPTYSELFGYGTQVEVAADEQEPMVAPEIGGRNSISPAPVSSNLTSSSGQQQHHHQQPAAGEQTRIISGPEVALSTGGDESRSSSNLDTTASCTRDYTSVGTIATTAGEQNKKNLLVKLNLNKTKLLSADDLVLLSQLIDVPIIVQHQQPPAAGAATAPAAVSSSSDDATTIDEEDEEEEEEEDEDEGVQHRSFGSVSQSSRQDHQGDGGIIRVDREIGRARKQANGDGGGSDAAAANDR